MPKRVKKKVKENNTFGDCFGTSGEHFSNFANSTKDFPELDRGGHARLEFCFGHKPRACIAHGSSLSASGQSQDIATKA